MARKFYNGIEMVGGTLTGLPDPSGNTDAVNLQYVQSLLRGLVIKDAVDAASTGNVSLSTPGSSMDGVTLSNPMRLLLKNQTDPTENGIFNWTGPSTALTRANDADGAGDLQGGSIVYVAAGTANGDKAFAISSPDGDVTIGTDSITWTQFGGGSAYTAGNGLQLVGSAFSILLDSSSGLSVSGSGLKIDTSVVARRFSGNIGNGSATSPTFTHNLGHKNYTVSVHDNSTFAEIECDIVKGDNAVTCTFAAAPSTNAYTVVVVG